MARGHAERLLPVLQEVLSTAGWSWRSIELIAVTLGPGNFTGLRAGLAVARGLSLAVDRPALGLGTLEVMAQAEAERRPGAGPMQVVLDARRGEVYAQPFADDLTPLDEPRLLPEAEVASLPYRRAVMPPEARSLALLAAHRLAGGSQPIPGSALRPLYLRAPDARLGAGASLLPAMV
jgi:N6-L-threonylcarbamoyladenine synthase